MSSSDEIDLDAKLPAAASVAGGAEIGAAQAVGDSAAVALEGTQAIAEGLSSGALDPVAAQQLLIDQVLAAQFGPDIAPDQLARLRGELAELLDGDPTLLALLRA